MVLVLYFKGQLSLLQSIFHLPSDLLSELISYLSLIYGCSLLRRETRWLIALKSLRLNRSSLRVGVSHQLSARSHYTHSILRLLLNVFCLLACSEPLPDRYRNTRGGHGTQAGAGRHVLRSDARAAADGQLRRADQLSGPPQGVRITADTS